MDANHSSVKIQGMIERLDKWLWAVRMFKTRAEAADACRLGRVTIRGQPVKASREVRTGETIVVRHHDVTRTIKVKESPAQRVGARLVPEFLDDLTPPEEWERARRRREERRLAPPTFPPGFGRPTKHQRREIEKFLRGTEEEDSE
jgi:ribosome-associated heat shock protein Hsp15